jgi:Heterokaryon incompatibility protein (HET)
MRLLNIRTLRLEWFHNADVAPSYAILTHRWEDEEVLFEDVADVPGAQELRMLQKKLEEAERRLESFSRKIAGEAQAKTPYDSANDPSASLNALGGIRISAPTVELDSVGHVHQSQVAKPKGWSKVLGCCKIAEQFGISYVWIDTCCIDTTSNSELSESLNSMFAWYQCATLCIAYLSDVTQNWGDDFEDFADGHPRQSAWFRRGWTLQELIAPNDILFYRGDWTFLGIRSGLVDELHKVTGIEKAILQRNGLEKLHSLSVAARMSCKFLCG